MKNQFNKLSNDQIKKSIQDKFGSLARFCRLSNNDLYDLNKLLRLKKTPENIKKLKEIYLQSKTIKDSIIADEELTTEQIELIRKGIYQKSRNIIKFCEDNPAFLNTWISKLLHGEIRKITPKTKRLAKILKVEL
jgi:predicted nucleotidyltransferase component of viral defense system